MNYSRKWPYNKAQSQVENAPYWYDHMESVYLRLLEKRLALDEEIRTIREQILDAMVDESLRGMQTIRTKVVYIGSYDGRRIDSGRLKKDHPEIFKKYSKPYTMPEHIQITVKKQK